MSEEPVKMDPFVPEIVAFEVGGVKLEIKALPLKKFREALGIVKAALSLIQLAAKENEYAIMDKIPEVIAERFIVLAPILLQRPDLDAAWWEGHISVPLARKIVEEAIRLNGVKDFLAQLQFPNQKVAEKLVQDSTLSTTPSPLPTGGQ